MPGIMWYFVVALVVLLGVILAVPSEGADHRPASAGRPFHLTPQE